MSSSFLKNNIKIFILKVSDKEVYLSNSLNFISSFKIWFEILKMGGSQQVFS